MTGYSGSPEEDRDYAIRESEHEPPIEMLLTEEELAERNADFDRVAAEIVNLSGTEDDPKMPLASVALTREDSDTLRVAYVKLYDAIDLFIAQSVMYSSEVQRMLIKGDGAKMIRFMLDKQGERTKQVQALQNVLITDWRLALLVSLEMTPQHLAHWLPEYEEQLQAK